MSTEPMTFSLLFDKEVFAKFIDENKNNNIGKSFINKYDRYWQSKEELYKKKNEYIDKYGKIAGKKNEYNLKSNEIFTILINPVAAAAATAAATPAQLIATITDIRIYELLSIQTDVTSSDINSQLYFNNITDLKLKKDKLVKERSLLSDVNNEENIKKYTDDPWLLFLLQKQFDMYYLIISLSFNSNQLNIWKIYYRETEGLVNIMINYFFEKMQKTNERFYLPESEASTKSPVASPCGASHRA